MENTRIIELDAHKISFLLDAISMFDSDSNYVSEDGKYSLSSDQIAKLKSSLTTLFWGINNNLPNNSRVSESSYWTNIRPDYM